MDLRPYQTTDRDACLAVFDSNAPDLIAAAERGAFAAFLENPPASYYVLDHEGAIAGCGGYTLESPESARLCWVLVRRDLHRNGLGRLLVFSAMKKMTAEGDPAMVRLRATPQSAAFFEKQGFRPVDALGAGMIKKLKVCP